jgi:hypothetical protein
VHRATRTSGGCEEFISKKSFGSKFDIILEMQGVHGRSKPLKGKISEEITQKFHRERTYSMSKISEEIILERE